MGAPCRGGALFTFSSKSKHARMIEFRVTIPAKTIIPIIAVVELDYDFVLSIRMLQINTSIIAYVCW
jgi:hypothetical protein